MASEIQVDTILPQSSSTLTLGNSGSTVNVTGTLDGSGLTGLNASNITTGTLDDARLSGNVLTTASAPVYTSISPDTIEPSTATDITITGSNFTNMPIVEIIASDGDVFTPNSITFNSSTSLTINVTLATNANYFIRIENPNGLATRSTAADLTVSDGVTFVTASGTLGTFDKGASINVAVTASSDSAVDFSKISGTFPTGLSLGSTQNTVYIAGTESSSITNETTYNFTLRGTDQESQTADRAFSITIQVDITESMSFE